MRRMENLTVNERFESTEIHFTSSSINALTLQTLFDFTENVFEMLVCSEKSNSLLMK